MSEQHEHRRLKRLHRLVAAQERLASGEVAALEREIADLAGRSSQLASSQFGDIRIADLTTAMAVKWLARAEQELARLGAERDTARKRVLELSLRLRLIDEQMALFEATALRRAEERELAEMGPMRGGRREREQP